MHKHLLAPLLLLASSTAGADCGDVYQRCISHCETLETAAMIAGCKTGCLSDRTACAARSGWEKSKELGEQGWEKTRELGEQGWEKTREVGESAVEAGRDFARGLQQAPDADPDPDAAPPAVPAPQAPAPTQPPAPVEDRDPPSRPIAL